MDMQPVRSPKLNFVYTKHSHIYRKASKQNWEKLRRFSCIRNYVLWISSKNTGHTMSRTANPKRSSHTKNTFRHLTPRFSQKSWPQTQVRGECLWFPIHDKLFPVHPFRVRLAFVRKYFPLDIYFIVILVQSERHSFGWRLSETHLAALSTIIIIVIWSWPL